LGQDWCNWAICLAKDLKKEFMVTFDLSSCLKKKKQQSWPSSYENPHLSDGWILLIPKYSGCEDDRVQGRAFWLAKDLKKEFMVTFDLSSCLKKKKQQSWPKILRWLISRLV
jgi:hypothetical protein